MKPVSVRFRGFGPYQTEQYIDFAQLERGGLFLICGDTGAGKTTVLDAMCCALYGESSGGTRGSFEVMRCKTASREEPTVVEFIFDHAGQRYKFVRELKYARKNLNDHHNCMIEKDGVFVPLLENPTKMAVTKQAQTILGLTVGQFRQIIILPQGQFETLLVSDSVEKEKILTSIFHADRWDVLAQSMAAEVRARDTKLKAERVALETVWARYECEDTEAMARLLEEYRQTAQALEVRVGEKDQAYAAEQKLLEAMITDEQLFKQLEQRKQQYTALASRRDWFEEEERCLQAADEAQRLFGVFEQYRAAATTARQAAQQEATAQQALEQAKVVVTAAQTAFDTHKEREEESKHLAREAVVLGEKTALYERLPSLREAMQSAALQKERTEERYMQKREAKERAEQVLAIKRDEQAQAIAACEQAEERYFQSIGGVLATTLTTGQPCPVCGSTAHPKPAVIDGEGITEAVFKQFKDRRAAAIRAFDTAQEELSNASMAVAQHEEEMRRVSEQALACEKEWLAALKARVDGIDTAAQLHERITMCTNARAVYEEKERQLSDALTKAQTAVRVALSLLEERAQAVKASACAAEEAKAHFEEALRESSFENEAQFTAACIEDEELQQRKAFLEREKAALAHAKEELERQKALVADKVCPAVEEYKQRHEQAAEELNVLRRDLLLVTAEKETLEKDLASCILREKQYNEERRKTDADLEFSKRISGSSGISLKRYVLGVMLSNITAQANTLLESVYAGRYRLYRTDDIAGSGHKGGLELEVLDAQSNERRSVTTLSGGEKFLVALSLAIGLSAVVQAQGGGVRLEAMFVDEGFGSLSREAVGDALDILQGVQKSSGIVGIISHVDKLAEAIPNRIEVIKTPHGSECRVVCNA